VALSVGGQRLEILVGFGEQGKCEGAPPRRKASWMTKLLIGDPSSLLEKKWDEVLADTHSGR
jgi:hypothetical protein